MDGCEAEASRMANERQGHKEPKVAGAAESASQPSAGMKCGQQAR